MLLNCGVGEDSWESLELQGDPTSPSYRRSVLGVHWKEWCWSWNANTLATWCKELTHWKRPWCWERLKAGGEGATEDEMVWWHHRLNGHGFGWTLGVVDGQGGLAGCGSQGCKELDTTEWLNWTEYAFWKASLISPKSNKRNLRKSPLPLSKVVCWLNQISQNQIHLPPFISCLPLLLLLLSHFSRVWLCATP